MSQICRLTPVALADQVAALADQNEFDDALHLCGLLPDEERQQVEDVLRARLDPFHPVLDSSLKHLIAFVTHFL